MNKSISIVSFIFITLITAYLKLFTAVIPANSQSLNTNLPFKESNFLTINFSDQESKDNLVKIAFLGGLIGTGAIFWKLAQSRSPSKLIKSARKKSDQALLNRVSPKLRRQLLRLINDPKTVNRLLMGIYQNNRDRSPDWIAEKVIYDLRRGR